MAGVLLRRRGEHDIVERVRSDFRTTICSSASCRETTGQPRRPSGPWSSRHGPMVLGHLPAHSERRARRRRRVSGDVPRAGPEGGHRSGTGRSWPGWLHEVAHRIAVKARASAHRRRTLERQVMAMLPAPIEPNGQNETAAWNELRPVLHDEVARLPEKYRLPVILCYLEGKTNEEAAELLHWPVGTVKGRLSRASDLLRSRLMRRGLVLSAAFLLTAFSQARVFAEIVPAELVRNTVRAGPQFGPRGALLSGVPPPGRATRRHWQHAAGSSRGACSQSVLLPRRAWWQPSGCWFPSWCSRLPSGSAWPQRSRMACRHSVRLSRRSSRALGGGSDCHADRER